VNRHASEAPAPPGWTAGPPPTGARVYEALALFFAIVPVLFGPLLFGAVRTWSVAPLMACAWLGLALLALRPLVFRANVPISVPPGTVPTLILLVYLAVVAPYAICPYEARLRWLMIGSALASAWCVSNLAGRHGCWKLILGLLLVVAGLEAVYAWIRHLQGSRVVLAGVLRHEGYGMRMGGTYVCPNHFANLLAMALPLALALITAPEIGGLWKVLAAYALLAIPWPLVLSQSRTGFAVALGGLGFTALCLAGRRGWRKAWAVALAFPIVAIVACTVVWSYAPGLTGRLMRTSTDLQSRALIWKGTLRMIRDAPWIGHGGGSFRLIDSLYVPLWPNTAAVHAHNDYLHVAAEYGLIGLALALCVGLVVIVQFVRGAVQARKDAHAHAAIGVLGMLAVALMQSLMDFNLHIYANSMTLVVALSAVASVLHATGVFPTRVWPRGWVWVGGPLIALISIVCAAASARAGMASVWSDYRARAAMEQGRLDDAEQLYRRALAWEPAAWSPWLGLADVAARRAQLAPDPDTRRRYLEETLRRCEEGMRRNPREPGFALLRSQALSMLGRSDEAVEVLRQAVRDYPGRPYIVMRLAAELDRQGKLDEALELMRRAARDWYDNPTVRQYVRVLELRKQARSSTPGR